MTNEPTIDEILDRAVQAINSGDRATADALAERVLAVDQGNLDAEELLASPVGSGEIRRLTIMFADLVDSTALSTRTELEVYRTVVGRYRDDVIKIVARYDGHLASTKGDGLLAVFGHPRAHENDAHRAVQAGLDITREVSKLSELVSRRFGFAIDVRVGIHLGLVYLDIGQDDVYGLGANLAARVCGLAQPGTVAVSAAIERVVRNDFETENRPAETVKGVVEPVVHFRVVGEHEVTVPSRGPLVGREGEVEQLRQRWARAERDGPLGVVLRGEGGIGKSRLAAAVVDVAACTESVILRLFGSPFHTDVGLRPVRRLLERRSGIERDSDPVDSLAKLTVEVERVGMDPVAVVPLLAPVLSIAPEAGYEPASANADRLYDQIVGTVGEYLTACIGDRPGLIIAEDVHWFDEDTIEVLGTILGGSRRHLLVVATGRGAPELPGDTETLDIKPLSTSQTDELIMALHPDMTPATRQAVQQRCDGIPLYIEEVITKLKELPSDSAESTQVPDTLYEALIARLRSVKSSHLVVEAAALIGGAIDRHVVSAVVDLEPSEVDGLLGELTRVRVLEQLGSDVWRFHHELLREVASELMPPSVRRRLHGRIADVLVASASERNPDWPSIAGHYEESERFDEACSAYQRASSNARQRGALIEARTHLNRALTCVDHMHPGRAKDHCEVSVRLERGFLASAATGHASTVASSEFERCLRLIGDEPSEALYATLSALWSFYATRGDLRRAAQLVDALRRRLDDMPSWYRVANDAVQGSLAVFRGEFETGSQLLEKAAAALESLPTVEIDGAWYAPNNPLAGLYTFVAFTRFIHGDLIGAEKAFRQASDRCQTLRFPHGPFTLCYGQATEALVRSEAGQYDLASTLVAEVADRGARYAFDEWTMVAASAQTTATVMASIASGERDPTALDAHISTLTALVESWRAANMVSFRAWYDAGLARVLLISGNFEAARDRIDLALRLANDTDWHIYDAELLRLRAHTSTDLAARHEGLLTAMEAARAQGALVFELRSAADDYAIMGSESRATLADLVARFSPDQSWPELDRIRALLR